MINAQTTVSEPKLLHSVERRINGVNYQVSVCQSPAAEMPLKQMMRSIILQRAENERKKLSET